jgi:hypothetical protein
MNAGYFTLMSAAFGAQVTAFDPQVCIIHGVNNNGLCCTHVQTLLTISACAAKLFVCSLVV